MKITKKEITLLFVVGVLLVAVLGFMYLIKPQMDKRPELVEAYKTADQKKTLTDTQIIQIPTLQNSIKDLLVNIENVEKRFFPITDNPELHIETIMPKESSASVTLEELFIEKDDPTRIAEKQIEPAPGAPTGAENGVQSDPNTYTGIPAVPVNLLNSSVTIRVKGSLEAVACSFAEQLEKEKVTIANSDGSPIETQKVIEIASVMLTASEDEGEEGIFTAEYIINFVSVE